MERRWTCVLSLVLLVLFSCRNEVRKDTTPSAPSSEKTGKLSDLIHNPVRPDGSIDSSYLPIITWNETLFDFGRAAEGDIITHEYHFKNTGTAPLFILNATSTCGCTVPEWSKEPVPINGEGFIRVEFNTTGKPGLQSKEVTIFANTFPNQSKITIRGTIDSKN